MYKTILVSNDIENGKILLDRLEKAGWRVTAAFWFHFEDEDQWKLIVVSPDVADKGPRLLYAELSKLEYDPVQPIQFPLERIMLVNPASLLYKSVKEGTGLKTTTRRFRDGLVEDVYIYKMS